MREEELKKRVARDFFANFDCDEIIADIDFAVKARDGSYLLWAEAKQKPTDMSVMLTQLVLTIGKARTFDEKLPPPFLGCFDSKGIAFVPYADVQHIFYQNDFNWNVAPSDPETREFKQVKKQVQNILGNSSDPYVFDFRKDEEDLQQFIRANFVAGKTETARIKIDKNNFIIIYNKWLDSVKPTIQVADWALTRKNGILDGDFYLADLLAAENMTLKEKLYVLLKSDHYVLAGKKNPMGLMEFMQTGFSDNQKKHKLFWAKYERPPLEEYWDYIIDRRDLLVPQDIRERKGSFYTPRIWVELSQKYIADVLGEDWQDEYTVWDCAAGTGNLLVGLVNKYNVWASTLDKADVAVMKDRIHNGANLLEDHVFQFDFLNDDFSKLPEGLRKIVSDEKKRKKLIIYINPPYAEAMNRRDAQNAKKDVNRSMIEKKYLDSMGKSVRELFAQFMTRIYKEIPNSKLAQFSKLKFVSSPNFTAFRRMFSASFKKGFVVRANTFDNVSGHFPIAFTVWDLGSKASFARIRCNVIERGVSVSGKKKFFAYNDRMKSINDWLKQFAEKNGGHEIAAMCCIGNDFQHNNFVNINHRDQLKGVGNAKGIAKFGITQGNLIAASVYFAVRKCVESTWLNDRDQFLYPKDSWERDEEFQNDCLAYTLFNTNIQSKHGENHWIPFTEKEVNARDKFDSHFMTDFMAGKTGLYQDDDIADDLFPVVRESRTTALVFSSEARNVLEAGKELWKYYHAQPTCNVNASLYDIREHFQGRNANGKMNNKSKDGFYNDLIANLRSALKTLASKIEPKVYEYGFLKE